MLNRRHLISFALGAVGACLHVADAGANPVLDWNRKAAAVVNEQTPLEQSRSLAIVQVAVHDALNAIEPRYARYAFDGQASGASPEAAVATAARDTLLATAVARSADIEAWYAQALAALPEGAAKTQGIDVGHAAAQSIISWRATDDLPGALTAPYEPGSEPGDYRATPPDDVVFAAGWGDLPTFSTPASSAFRPAPPPRVTSQRYAREYAEVVELGVLGSSVRTEEQTEIADFWYESSATGWMRIANVVASDHELDVWESARLLGLVGLALADGFINGFDAKYHYEHWRPITAIRLGDEDGNRRTRGVPDWTPHCATPPVADYPSTHSVLGAAAATVLAHYFGDRTPFTIDSLSLPGVTRSFERFSEAARENGESRVYCGIHWRSSVVAGLRQGRAIGRYVFSKELTRLRREH